VLKLKVPKVNPVDQLENLADWLLGLPSETFDAIVSPGRETCLVPACPG
jgi:hypothetical protein